MPLSAGHKLGPYEILAPIGAGGMGEVYKARDTRLDRVVAIKTLKEQFNERFDREARAVAALNHPHICQLYDVGPNYLVMEYIEGPTLAARIAAGAIPLTEALPMALQIVEALEAAHEKGIIHRDLKPANIKLTPDGKVKVLDFGLAKTLEGESTSASPADSPTLTLSATLAGVILGTAGYMSPEQVRGIPADKRADIWAFGVVVLEMLSGRTVFAGETMQDSLASVLKTDPDWSALPPATPPSIRRLLRRCLERDRQKRLRDIGDARLEIEEAAANDEQAEPRIEAKRAVPLVARWWPAIAVAALAVGAAGGFVLNRHQPEPKRMMQFRIAAPPGGSLLGSGEQNLAVAPDGGSIVYPVALASESQLWLTMLDSDNARPLPGTTAATGPAWSPDGRSLAFHQSDKLKRLELASGSVGTICDIPANSSVTWGAGGVMLFSKGGVVHKVSSTGGEPVATRFRGVRPRFLPDGSRFLYTAADPKGPAMHVAALDGSVDKKLLDGDWTSEYGGGYVFFRGEERALRARPFDLKRLEFTGQTTTVVEGLVRPPAVSASGTLVFRPESGHFDLQLVDRNGKLISLLNAKDKRRWGHPRFSPDASKLVIDEPTRGGLWVIDIARGIQSRLTFGGDPAGIGVFSPDASRIYYHKGAGATPAGIYELPANGAGTPKPVWSGDSHHMDISPDGKRIIAEIAAPGTGLIVIPLDGEGKDREFISSSTFVNHPRFSPDGKWVAYGSAETGSTQVYIQSYPPGAGKWQVSRDGGDQPFWRGDGKELYFVSQDREVMVCEIRPQGTALEVGTAKVLFRARFQTGGGPSGGPSLGPSANFAASRDGQRFVVNVPSDDGSQEGLRVIVNWRPTGARAGE